MTPTKTNRRYWLKLCVLLTVLSLSAAAFIPTPIAGRQGTTRQAALCRSKLSRLWTTTQTTSTPGAKAGASFTEGELNAHLASILRNNPQAHKGRGLTVGIDDLRVDIHRDQVRLFVIGHLTYLPFVLEYRTNSATGRAAGRCHSVRLGRLPLLPPFNWVAQRQLKRLMRGLTMEAEILRQLSALTIEGEAVRVEVTFKNPTDSSPSS